MLVLAADLRAAADSNATGHACHWLPLVAILGTASLLFLLLAHKYLALALTDLGMPTKTADLMGKLALKAAVLASTAEVSLFNLNESPGISIAGLASATKIVAGTARV